MKIIVYGSQYGTSRQYAEELARKTDIEALSFEKVGDINSYDTIIYIGALYAGGVLGMKKTFKNLIEPQSKKIIIVTVGLSDPTDKENMETIKTAMKGQLSADVYAQAHIFHLRGGIDYSKLKTTHKIMMGLLCKKAQNLPEDKKTTEVKAMLDTYNKQVCFVDFERLNPIIEDI